MHRHQIMKFDVMMPLDIEKQRRMLHTTIQLESSRKCVDSAMRSPELQSEDFVLRILKEMH